MAVALGEMERGNYFGYVMLINMAPPDLMHPNITLLMPNDKSLANTNFMADTSITDFLLRHSIPWPLLFNHMEHFPTGSIIPTSTPGFVLKVSNDGRRRFFFNNARIVSPNICTKVTSIRCHGIDRVLQPALLPDSSCPHLHPPPPLPSPSPPTNKNATHMNPSPLAPSSSPPSSTVVVADDSPSKSDSYLHHCYHPLQMAGVVSLGMMLYFIL